MRPRVMISHSNTPKLLEEEEEEEEEEEFMHQSGKGEKGKSRTMTCCAAVIATGFMTTLKKAQRPKHCVTKVKTLTSLQSDLHYFVQTHRQVYRQTELTRRQTWL